MKKNSNEMEIHECEYCDVLLPSKEDLMKHVENVNHTTSKCDCDSEMEVDENVNISKNESHFMAKSFLINKFCDFALIL